MNNKIKQITFIFISIIIIIGLTSIMAYTINNAKETLIEENSQVKYEEENVAITNEENYYEDASDSSYVAGAVENDIVEENSYTSSELAIIIICSSLSIVTILNLIFTKFAKTSLLVSLSNNKLLIYYCLLLVILCVSTSTITVIASDKNIINSYETKTLDEQSLAIINIDESKEENNINESSTSDNTSVLQVTNGASYTASSLNLTKESGATTSEDGSIYYGLNVALLVKKSSTLSLTDSNIISKSDYSSGIYVTGSNSNANIENTTIYTSGQNSPALISTYNAIITANNMDINTTGSSSPTIQTINTNSTINISESTLNAQSSSLLYSEGIINATSIESGNTDYLIGIIKNRGAISISESNLTTNAIHSIEDNIYSAFYIYDEEIIDSETNSKLTIADSDITIVDNEQSYEETPIFYISNTKVNINITNTTFNYSNNIFLIASNNNNDVTNVTLTITDEEITGDIIADSNSQIRFNLNNSTYKGKINSNNDSNNIDITFDYTSKWILTGDSYVNTIQITKTDYNTKNIKKYIKSNGYNVYYNPDNNEWLEGKTYQLNGGGKLIPLSNEN